MGNIRTIDRRIISSDKFVNLPASAQILYVQLIMNADDEGFLANLYGVMRASCADADDLEKLIENGYIIKFESGVTCISHWYIHNPVLDINEIEQTIYTEEKDELTLNRGIYYKKKADKGANPNNIKKPEKSPQKPPVSPFQNAVAPEVFISDDELWGNSKKEEKP